MSKYLSFTILLLTCLSSFAEDAALLSSFTNAKPIKRKNPVYPHTAMRNAQEGWVQLSFVIEKDGTVSHPVIEDSSGLRSFERNALAAIKKWTFTPATQDGKPVQQCKSTVQLDFAIRDNESAATRKFIRKFNKIKKMILRNEFDGAEVALKKLREGKHWNLYEDALYWYLSSMYYGAIKDFDREYRDILKMAERGEELLPPKNFVELMYRGFELALSKNQFSTALYFSRRIKRNDEVLFNKLGPALDKVEAVKNSNQHIVVDGKLNDRNNWFHYLYRNNFTIAEVQGNLDRIELRCDNSRHTYKFSPDNEWHIPQSWKGCRLLVTGDQNSQFKLVELANKA